MEWIAIVSLSLLVLVLIVALVALTVAWIRLNNKYKEHLALWGTVLSIWEEASSSLAQIANKERVLMYASQEAAAVSRIASTMLEAMIVASAQIGDSTVYLQTEKIVRRPPAQDVDDEEG